MKTRFYLSLATAALALAAVPLAGATTDPFDEQPVKVIQTTEAKFPQELTARGVREGEVRALLLVSAEGKLEDTLVTAYTHPELAVELMDAVRTWEYEPARLKGEPTGQRIQIVFHFHQRGAIVSLLPAAAVASSMNRLVPVKLTHLVCKAGELDRIPAVLERVSPFHPGKHLQPPEPNGNALIDFYIDAEGRPRMPVVMRATRVEFAVAAAEALMQWRFEPPTRNGRPIAVRMVQEFVF